MINILIRETFIFTFLRPSFIIFLIFLPVLMYFTIESSILILSQDTSTSEFHFSLIVFYVIIIGSYIFAISGISSTYLSKGFRELLFVRPIQRNIIIISLMISLLIIFSAIIVIIKLLTFINVGYKSNIWLYYIFPNSFFIITAYLIAYAVFIFLCITFKDYRDKNYSVTGYVIGSYIMFISPYLSRIDTVGWLEDYIVIKYIFTAVYYLTPPIYEIIENYIFMIVGYEYSLIPFIRGCAIGAIAFIVAIIQLNKQDF